MRSYLITDRRYYTDKSAVFRSRVHEQLAANSPDYALYRDKHNPDYALLAEVFLEVCAKFENSEGLLHGNVELAHKLHAFGVHLTSQQYNKIERAKELGLHVVASAHSEEEILKAVGLGADAVTYSPIFLTPNKGAPKGLDDLKEIVGKIQTNIFALGGITTPEQVNQVETTGAYGFASIRYFIDNA